MHELGLQRINRRVLGRLKLEEFHLVQETQLYCHLLPFGGCADPVEAVVVQPHQARSFTKDVLVGEGEPVAALWGELCIPRNPGCGQPFQSWWSHPVCRCGDGQHVVIQIPILRPSTTLFNVMLVVPSAWKGKRITWLKEPNSQDIGFTTMSLKNADHLVVC